jgi:hypothetical protein
VAIIGALKESLLIMKLIGSKTEQEFREQLIKSNFSLFNDEDMRGLLDVLWRHFLAIKSAYFLDHIPDQGVDFYKILINTDMIAQIELERHNIEAEPLVELIPIGSYKHGLSKRGQIQLAVAMDLSVKNP